jgi:hypothetical protein
MTPTAAEARHTGDPDNPISIAHAVLVRVLRHATTPGRAVSRLTAARRPDGGCTAARPSQLPAAAV